MGKLLLLAIIGLGGAAVISVEIVSRLIGEALDRAMDGGEWYEW